MGVTDVNGRRRGQKKLNSKAHKINGLTINYNPDVVHLGDSQRWLWLTANIVPDPRRDR